MTATERIINLALLLGTQITNPEGVSTGQIRNEIYPEEQSDHAFEKMFTRDKEVLRLAGIIIQADSSGSTRLVAEGTFCDVLDLSPAERATLALVGFAQLDEPLFPLPFALRMALTKLSGLLDADSAPALRQLPVHSALGIRDTETSDSEIDTSLYPELLLRAIQRKQIVAIDYTNLAGEKSCRNIAPQGMYLLSGRWYLVAEDSTSTQMRIFKVGRIRRLTLTDEHFEQAADFSLSDWISLPFEIGAGELVQTSIIIPADHSTPLDRLTKGRGTVSQQTDGSFSWHIGYRDFAVLVTFVLENKLHFGEAQHLEYAQSALEAMAGAS
ncbi:MAG: WYL domain-containing protein [Coriobacteriia bacterium]|nr:WYL domain-containing protein [Coriobacteriia bacterium]